ncbi:MAG: glycosyltransferase family 4 protein [Anaerolineae bacterium]
MRILFISNFYPPYHRGGYEEWCHEIAQRFLSAGHEVRVLTSTFQPENAKDDPKNVFRQLNLEMEMSSLSNGLKFFTHRTQRLKESLAHVSQHIADFRPDAVLVWGMWNLPFDIPVMAEQLLPGRVMYYLGDYWPTLPPQFKNYWEAKPGNWLTAIPKTLLAIPAKIMLKRESRPKLALEHGLFCSQYLQDELAANGVNFKNSQIVYGAIDTQPYQELVSDRDELDDRPTQLLSISRLIPDKGVETIISALAQLKHEHQLRNLHLKIIGSGLPVYEAKLRQLVADNQLENEVTFVGTVPKNKIPGLYQAADIFLFASIWPEPFGRVIVEAMASDLVVVGTAVGGAAEILESGSNALTFTPDDASDLANHLKRLIEKPELKAQLTAQAKQDALEKFDLTRMFQQIEAQLASIID